MKRTEGITLVEMLVALVILVTVFSLSSSGIISGLQAQNQNEAATSLQAKLRRVNEVISQDIRGSVLGGITNYPYTSGERSVSFILLEGGAGYQVLPHDSGNNTSFKNAANLKILAPSNSSADELNFEDGQALMVNGNGEAIIFDISTVQKQGGSSGTEYKLMHPGCKNTLDYTPNTLLFNVRTVGLEYDTQTKTLFQREGDGDAVPLAFDLEDFRLDYIYVKNDGSTNSRSTPLLGSDGTPLRTTTDSVLSHLQVTLDGKSPAKTNALERSYTSQVGLSSNSNFNLGKVNSCN